MDEKPWPYDLDLNDRTKEVPDDMMERISAARHSEFTLRDYPEGMKVYLGALGEFVTWFSYCEGALFRSFAEIAGTSPDITNAVFPGVRVDTCIQYIKRMMQVKEIAEEWRTDLEEVMAQIKIINIVRNTIIHQGPSFDQDWKATYSNKGRALTPQHLHRQIIDPEVLANLTMDLMRCVYILDYRNIRSQGLIELELFARGPYWYWSSKPWSYKATGP